MSTNLFGQFKIYPRGFLGAKLEPILINKGASKNSRLQYDVSLFDANEPELITANMAIEEAYVALVRKDILSSDFDFRETCLRAILKAFGTLDFEGWYMAQYQSPSFSTMQQEFLEDCFRFINTGKRNMSLQNWDVLLQASDDKITDFELPELAKARFNKKFVRELSPSGRTMVPGIVQDWIAKPNGFTDLLVSCHILFGIKR